jgi:predicted aldo/keto reductase-like oxidoreductase
MGIDAFKKDFEQSFERLKVDVIDFYGFHAVNQPPELEMAMGAPLEFLKEQKEKGRIKHILITGHNAVTMTEAVKTGEFEMAMFPFNVIEREPLDMLLDTAHSMGVATSVMKPMAGGVIESKALALRFFLSYQAGVVTPGMSSIQQLEQNFEVFDKRTPLSEDEIKKLEEEVSAFGEKFCRRCSYCMPCENGIMIPFVHAIHMKCYGKPMDDEVSYMLQMGKRMLPAIEKCSECNKCVEKCPYDIPTPQRVKELCELLASGK